jgi:hypothetical protein
MTAFRDQAAYSGLLAQLRAMGLFCIWVRYEGDKSFTENDELENNS